MDFLKNLSLNDKEKQTEAAPPEPAAPVSVEPEREQGFLEKVFGHDDKPSEPPAAVAKPPPEPKRSSFIEKITGNHDEEPAASVAPPPVPEKNGSFLGKLIDKFDGEDDKEVAKPPPVPAKEKDEGLLEKLFHGKAEAETPPPPPPKSDGFLDKIVDVFNGPDSPEDKEADLKRREEDLKRREEELRKKSGDVEGHGIFDGLKFRRDSELPPSKEEAEKNTFLDHLSRLGQDKPAPPEGQGLGAKLHAALGGGPLSEAKEDHLDKAIDFVQKHILKSGDQSNESALEQLKDEQISDAIRKQYKAMTGHEFPVKDKEH